MPLMLTFYQKKLFKLDHIEIEASLTKKINEKFEEKLKFISESHEAKELELTKKLDHLKKELEKNINHISAGVFHVQGNTALQNKEYLTALDSYINAVNENISADNDFNLQRVIRQISLYTLRYIYQDDLERAPEVEIDFHKMIEKRL